LQLYILLDEGAEIGYNGFITKADSLNLQFLKPEIVQSAEPTEELS